MKYMKLFFRVLITCIFMSSNLTSMTSDSKEKSAPKRPCRSFRLKNLCPKTQLLCITIHDALTNCMHIEILRTKELFEITIDSPFPNITIKLEASDYTPSDTNGHNTIRYTHVRTFKLTPNNYMLLKNFASYDLL